MARVGGRWHALALAGAGAVAALLLAISGCTAVSRVGGDAPLATPTLAASATPGTATPAAHFAVTMRRDVVYGPLAMEQLDLCLPRGAVGARPGMVVIHGGAWSFGDKLGFDGYCAYFASLGFVAASINYRLAPRWVWPAQLLDAQLAVRYLRAHALSLSLDPGRMCAMGESSGGHLAVFLGSQATIRPGDTASLWPDESPRVSCVVDLYGPVDLTRPLPQLDGYQTFQRLLGGATRASDLAAYRDASPLFLISPASAPTLIIQGDHDVTVPPQQSRLLQSALQVAGVRVTYIAYDGGHNLTGLTAAQRADLTRQMGVFALEQTAAG
ncbi:MAG: alpha/beta hydrolase fold domain-containing protein [Ktedonobacterales bacterium]